MGQSSNSNTQASELVERIILIAEARASSTAQRHVGLDTPKGGILAVESETSGAPRLHGHLAEDAAALLLACVHLCNKHIRQLLSTLIRRMWARRWDVRQETTDGELDAGVDARLRIIALPVQPASCRAGITYDCNTNRGSQGRPPRKKLAGLGDRAVWAALWLQLITRIV